jgi:outer membrane lipoprotein-sorting protein
LSKKRLVKRATCVAWVTLAGTMLLAPGCAVKRTTRVSPSQLPPPAKEASAAELIAKVNAQSAAVRTLVATVELAPTAGSVYSGVIKEYRDVRGFILLEKPAMIRMIGQAPVVRTNIFDMVSDGREFKLYIPTKQKFIVGRNDFRRPAKNSLENLRPQHILHALLLPAIDLTQEKYFVEEAEEGAGRYYVLSVFETGDGAELQLNRKVWFDRATLAVSRLQLYGLGGSHIEDVHYSNYQDFQGVNFPTRIEIIRPIEDYRLGITIQKATFNQPISPEKFELNKPEGAQLVELGAQKQPEEPHGQ